MSDLQTRISALITAIGADIKALKTVAPVYGGYGVAPLVGNYLQSFIQTGASAAAITRNTVTYVPVYVPVARAFDRIAVNVTTAAAGGTTPAMRLGIYADDGTCSKPGALILDAGTVTITAAATNGITIAITLQPGLYWVAAQYTDAGAPTTALQCSCVTSAVSLPGSGFAANYRGLSASATAGALPSTASTPLAPSGTTGTMVGLRGA